jgi:hypothetical protein
MKAVGLALVVSLGAAQGWPQERENPRAALELGITQFTKGDHALAVFTLEDAIRRFTPEPDRYVRELTQAYVYRGAALVGLGLEDNAKGSFAAALKYGPTLRLTEREFPVHVVRAFEATLAGNVPAVLVPPPKKRHKIGGLAIAGIAAGAAAAAVGIAAATSGEVPPGPAEFSFVTSSPPPGSTISTGPGRALPLFLTVMMRHPTEIASDGELSVFLQSESGARCASMSLGKVYAPPDTAIPLNLSGFRYADEPEGGCALPSTTTKIAVRLSRGGQGLHDQDLSVSYTFVRQP